MRPVLASICFCVLAHFPAMAADHLVGGPFVVNVTGRSANVVWVVQSTNGTLHAKKSALTDLEPGKTYPYTIKEAGGASGSFRTAPSVPCLLNLWSTAILAPGTLCTAAWWRPS